MVVPGFQELPPEEQRRLRALGDELSKVPMTYAVPVYFGGPPGSAGFPKLNNGTGSLISVGGAKFCITNWHVLDLYRARRASEPELIFQVANVRLDPERVLISENRDYDLAVLGFAEWGAEEAGSDGEVPTQFLDVASWPPELPAMGNFVMFGGYPGYWREVTGPAEVRFDTLSWGAAEVIDSNIERLVCQLQIDKCLVHRAEPGRDQPGELGGLSGGPVLRQKQSEGGITTFEFVGIIYEYGKEFDCLFIRPASLITEDGRIAGPSNLPNP